MADTEALAQQLTQRISGEVRFDAGARAAYSADASNYRQIPIGVVIPRSVTVYLFAVLTAALRKSKSESSTTVPLICGFSRPAAAEVGRQRNVVPDGSLVTSVLKS